VSSGKECIKGRCPYQKCNVQIPVSMFRKYLSPKLFKEYKKLLYKSYTDDNKEIQWCPKPLCEYYAENPSLVVQEILCKCGFEFCFGCNEETHSPVPCEKFREWRVKNSAESENVIWIIANTKPCTKCSKHIEKNQGYY
jgi:ariadne-1